VSEQVGLKINTKKTEVQGLNGDSLLLYTLLKVMKITRDLEMDELRITMDGVLLDEVPNFVYLGASISMNGNLSGEVARRVALAKKSFREFNAIWRDRGLQLSSKFRLYRATILPSLLYAAETMALNKAQTTAFDVVDSVFVSEMR
jgi:hypothetical protein